MSFMRTGSYLFCSLNNSQTLTEPSIKWAFSKYWSN